jgi:hypothetical protein
MLEMVSRIATVRKETREIVYYRGTGKLRRAGERVARAEYNLFVFQEFHIVSNPSSPATEIPGRCLFTGTLRILEGDFCLPLQEYELTLGNGKKLGCVLTGQRLHGLFTVESGPNGMGSL